MSTQEEPTPDPVIDEGLEAVLREEGRELLLHRMHIGILMGIPLYLGFAILDYLVAQDLWWTFLGVRLAVVAVAVVCIGLPFFGLARKYARTLSFIITYTGSAGISVMTAMLVALKSDELHGGTAVEYWVGILMILFLVGLFCPWGFRLTASYSASVIGTFLVLNLGLAKMTWDQAIVPTFFMVGTALLTCWAADAIEKVRRKEIALRAQLESANAELKVLDEAKSKFFANVSHELRTPLMLILGPLESLLAGEQTEPEPMLRAMDANAHRLMRQVNMILNFSKLEAGQQSVDRELGNVGRLLTTLVEGAAPYAAGRGITLAGDGLDTLPDIPFDQEKIETAAANLISNAMKFTPDGGSITVRGGVEKGGIWFEVEDTGCGIPEDQLDKVFERFHQVDGGRAGKVQGTGLGLALSKELVELHGGRMAVRSRLGEGTTFRVELPDADAIGWSRQASDAATPKTGRGPSSSTEFADLARPGLEERAAAAPADPVQAPDDAPTLLLVEDNPDMRAFVAGALRRHYKVHTAVDGQDGLETARLVEPDIIVSDVMMPRLDGFEMVEQLRQDRRFDRTPIVMLTARTGAEAVVRGLRLGAVDYVAKPFKMPELLARISAQLRMRAVEAELDERDSRLVAVGQMTGSIAHDLRGPLSGIYNRIEFVRMVSDRNGSLDVIDGELDAVECSVKRINTMIQELLDFVRGAGTRLDRHPTRLASWLDEVVEDVGRQLKDVGVDVTLDVADGGGQVQCALDRERMQRVVENLVNNARDAMLGAGVAAPTVRVRLDFDEDRARIVVEDDGPGIPDELRGSLFQPFATSGKRNGTGLGLAIARNFVVGHGGDIELTSGAGEGARFVITLPRLRSGRAIQAA